MRIDFGAFILRSCVYSPGLRQPRHSHEHSNVTIVTHGQLDESAEGGHYCGRPSAVVLKAAGSEHETQISGFGARTLTIEFGQSFSLPPQTWWWSEEPEIVRGALALQRASNQELESRANDLLALVITANEIGRAVVPPWISTVKTILDYNFDRPQRFEELARDLGLHPVYVSRAFHRHVGSSMTDYVRGLRLREARHLLTSSLRSVAAIASEAGFADSSHLCRTFSNLLEITPKAYRRLCGRQV